ncbi:MAG: hypothetical protein V4725_06715 [Bacteroidota bacterium]
MALNLLESIQTKLNYPPLQKIDPNTEEVKVDSHTPNEHRFSQAAIPAIITGLYAYSAKDDQAERIIRGNDSSDWVNEFFGNRKEELLGKIARYSFYRQEDISSQKLQDIAQAAIQTTRENLKPNASVKDVKDYLSGQITHTLPYLPAALKMGEMVNEETLDDNTNKMEGPVSSLMHKIASAFSNPTNEDEVSDKNK